MGKTALDVLVDQIDELQSSLKNKISTQGASDYPMYTEMCGRIRGLRNARDMITDLAKKLEGNDDE